MTGKISVSWIEALSIYLIIKCPWQKERLCSRILSDVKFAVFLWPGINKINVDHGVRYNQYPWQPGNFFLCSTTVAEVANAESDTKT